MKLHEYCMNDQQHVPSVVTNNKFDRGQIVAQYVDYNDIRKWKTTHTVIHFS